VAQQSHAASAPLRRRSMLEQLRRDVTRGLMTSRHLP
jgi:UDP-glucose 4-epimerase